MELKGCAAIVTGGSGGLGQRICRALALAGVNVVVNYAESAAKAQNVAADLSKLGVRALALQADVTDPAAVERMVKQTKAEFGRVDILVNDAAFNKTIQFSDLDGMTHELWNHVMTTRAPSSAAGRWRPRCRLRARAASSTSPPAPASSRAAAASPMPFPRPA